MEIFKETEFAGTPEMRGCVNVRRDMERPEVWRPAPMVRKIADGAWRPCCELGLKGERVIFFSREGRLGAADERRLGAGSEEPTGTAGEEQTGTAGEEQTGAGSEGAIYDLGYIGAEPILATELEGGLVALMLKHKRTIYLSYTLADGKFSFKSYGEMPILPGLTIADAEEQRMAVAVPGTKLSGVTGTSTALTAADTRKVAALLSSSYASLKSRAEAMGRSIPPVLARYRLTDSNGDTLLTGPTVMVGPKSGFQCTGEVELQYNGETQSLGGGQVAAQSFFLAVSGQKTLAQPWRSLVRNLIVETSPMPDPTDGDSDDGHSRINHGQATTGVSCHLPGVESTAAGENALLQQKIAQAIRADRWAVQAEIAYPFGEDATTDTSIYIGIRNRVTAKAPVRPWLRDSETFGCAAEAGGRTALGNLRRTGETGLALRQYFTGYDTTATGGWRGMVSVEIEDGETVSDIITGSGNSGMPTGVSPILSYPDPSARKITLSLQTGSGENAKYYTFSAAMTALPELGSAYALDNRLLNQLPDATDHLPALSESSTRESDEPDRMRLCEAGHTSEPLSSLRTGSGAIRTVREAIRAAGSWDHSRLRLIAFGESGATLIIYDKHGSVHSTSTLIEAPISSADAICRAQTAEGAALLAIAGGSLLKIGATGVKTLIARCEADAVAYDQINDEIWLCREGEKPRRVWKHDGKWETSEVDYPPFAQGFKPSRLTTMATLTGSDGVYDPTQEEEKTPDSDGLSPIRISIRRKLRRESRERLRTGVRRLLAEVDLAASRFTGTVTLSIDGGTRQPRPVAKLTVSGCVNHPYRILVALPRAEQLEWTAEGRGSDDMEIRP